MINRSNKDNSLLVIKTIFTSLTIHLLLNTYPIVVQSEHDEAPTSPAETKTCTIFRVMGANQLGINDIVVKNQIGNLTCIRARFSLAIRVETFDFGFSQEGFSQEDPPLENGLMDELKHEKKRIFLGHIDLGSVLKVEESCPESISAPEKLGDSGQQTEEEEMIVKFECGKLTFVFKRDDHFYLSAIRGVVNLDANTVEDFVVEQPMFLTSDLNHYFKFNDLIEVNSTVQSKEFILSAHFYHSEFETFRNTNSRDFIRSPDENSQPFAQ